jgi:CysZ protein
MFSAALAAVEEIFTPPFRAVLWKSLGLTALFLALGWVGLERAAFALMTGAPQWLASIGAVVTGIGLILVMGYLVAPVSALVASFFLDELAERVEASIGRVGLPISVGSAVATSAKFTVLSVLVNAIALAVFLVPGFNAGVFVVANAYLLGREYFELAAMRFRPIAEAREMSRRHRGYLFICGLPIAILVAIPVLNLLTPLFATAYMVRIHRALTAMDGEARSQPAP